MGRKAGVVGYDKIPQKKNTPQEEDSREEHHANTEQNLSTPDPQKDTYLLRYIDVRVSKHWFCFNHVSLLLNNE